MLKLCHLLRYTLLESCNQGGSAGERLDSISNLFIEVRLRSFDSFEQVVQFRAGWNRQRSQHNPPQSLDSSFFKLNGHS